MIKLIILIFSAFFLGSVVVCQPHLLASNTFLQGFLTHEVLALLAVIFTISLASVANIEISIGRLEKGIYRQKDAILASLQLIRKEIRDNILLLFWFLIVAISLLVVRGWVQDEYQYLISIIYAALIWILLLFILVIYDIYQVASGLSRF